MEKAEARQKFDRALEEDKSAVMATVDPTATDSFIIQLGHIEPDSSVKVRAFFM